MPPVLHRQAEAGRHRWARRALRAPLRSPGQEVENDRLDQLRATKLRTLVQGITTQTDFAAAALPGGAALVSTGAGPRHAYVLIDDGKVSRFGAALAWAWRAEAAELDVAVQDGVAGAAGSGAVGAAGVMARRAAEFARPAVRIWSVEGRELTSVDPAGPPPRGADESEFSAVLADHGIEPVIEHGVLRGEVLGLEVARVVAGRLEVGVGRHDRHARLEMRASEDLGAALDEAAAAVRELRRPGAPSHPANTLARGRWLRSVVCKRPAMVGASTLEAVAPPVPWFDLPEAGAAPAVGRSSGGSPLVVVCAVGIDLDLVATGADCRRIYDAEAELVLVVPEGDDAAITRQLAALLRRPARVQTVPRDWMALSTTQRF